MALTIAVWGVTTVACSTVTVRVPVMRPAEINLRGKSELVIAGVSAPSALMSSATEVNNLLKNAIVNSGRFKLIDRQHLDKVMRELSLSQTDLTSPDSRRKLGKLMTGSIMLFGQVEKSNYAENVTSNRQTCTRSQGKKSIQVPCTKLDRNGQADVVVAFDVIDVQTGENLKPKRLTCTERRNTSATDAQPAPIDGQSMIAACNQQVVERFMKAIAPWQDFVNAPFEKDGDVPPLEIGINYAKQGEWTEAIDKFKAAVDMTNGKPGIKANVVAKAHWNLGLAYEYTFQFDPATEEVKKAYDMTQNEAYLREISNIKNLKAEQDKLKEQIEAPPAGGV